MRTRSLFVRLREEPAGQECKQSSSSELSTCLWSVGAGQQLTIRCRSNRRSADTGSLQKKKIPFIYLGSAAGPLEQAVQGQTGAHVYSAAEAPERSLLIHGCVRSSPEWSTAKFSL